jgi:hypothetical protein
VPDKFYWYSGACILGSCFVVVLVHPSLNVFGNPAVVRIVCTSQDVNTPEFHGALGIGGVMTIFRTVHRSLSLSIGLLFACHQSSVFGKTYLSPLLAIGFDDFLSVGGAASYLLEPNGFVSSINNSLHVEGLVLGDLVGDYRVVTLGGRLRWDFHFHPQWTVFGAPGFRVHSARRKSGSAAGAALDFGGFYHLNQNWSLRAETSFIWFDNRSAILAGASYRF